MIRISGNTYYIPGAVNIGLYIRDGFALAIDSGSDESYAKKVLRDLESEGVELLYVINTHSHADHFGGNFFIKKKKPNVKFLAPRVEEDVMQFPEFEPFYLYGASPLPGLRNKFLMAKECSLDRAILPGKLELGFCSVEIISLKGHSPNQIGVLTEDGVLFSADAFFDQSTIEKYKLIYLYDLKNTLSTIESLEKTDYNFYVPGHGSLLEDVKAVLYKNRDALLEVLELIKGYLKEPHTREDVLSHLSSVFNMEMNLSQYFLNLASVSSFLSYLSEREEIDSYIEGGRLYFIKK